MGLSAVIARFKQTASGRGRIYAARNFPANDRLPSR